MGGGGLGLWEGIDWKVSKGTLQDDGNILDLGRGWVTHVTFCLQSSSIILNVCAFKYANCIS